MNFSTMTQCHTEALSETHLAKEEYLHEASSGYTSYWKSNDSNKKRVHVLDWPSIQNF